MICASLGFGSLLLAPAKPLRELGLVGVAGTVVALICAYVMYPAFLAWAEPAKWNTAAETRGSGLWPRKFVWVAAGEVLLALGLSFGLPLLNTEDHAFQ